ncbi:bifunctional 4-hydroxy-2-oxoglutarate aldolase/2-dehydro-3-deoxy-phosphogluconate aldolase [Nonomuraea sp. KC401]|uniref:bifunctional 4-hydroxy-2-oxoglutarate aldolase/2-dehydro-3-deoxy-phosphogluconate aldolase n=1 Tax=unclassified Nonomuraea TaxID=2593643 RepID=UPI0010FD050B|nr:MULTISPECIES: bifunctional 4-hydroxy-2-oxoglutarate aldolase/2-dehydro-3-deoxy-phosphogluconate aldolase [unclassified Nonomuraea]NBE94700.1 bifunctional 4-hydroxy-2-oxoglutarate aldolase/2-dehydro-3-deoxy-phosphogluconate aldolase [Nonomuraea sp. K271]TLF75635.1 bifunctional 4-hydroxy-2-oxoglutarate aldolase/2-dehydro-3-deoxy-phosphogluconate aldolase [Nonomuraea sp. KC401]
MSSLLDLTPVIPVVVIDDADTAVPLARALVAGGLPVIEVTLRTPAAREAIARIAAEVPEATVGAGTIRTSADISASVAAGARFLVSPGTTLSLVEALDASGVPYLPGAATVSEAMALAERGVKELKFFPAEAAGGVPYVKALSGPLPDVRFCPTGGIRADTAAGYLALPNVACVGGTWLTPADALAAGDWGRVEKLASEAAALR